MPLFGYATIRNTVLKLKFDKLQRSDFCRCLTEFIRLVVYSYSACAIPLFFKLKKLQMV